MIVHLLPPWALSDERAGSQYGVLLVDRTNASIAYGPPDAVDFSRSGGVVQPAAYFVASFGKRLQGDERAMAEKFLKQWPEGPQVDGPNPSSDHTPTGHGLTGSLHFKQNQRKGGIGSRRPRRHRN